MARNASPGVVERESFTKYAQNESTAAALTIDGFPVLPSQGTFPALSRMATPESGLWRN
jgi:hypothetical protein